MTKLSASARFLIWIGGLSLFVFLSVFILTTLLGQGSQSGVTIGRDKIAIIEIQGVILDSKRVVKSLERFTKDRNVKGIILRIDSPGGAVAPSQEIYSALLKIHEQGEKKTMASFGNVAASGAYYVASATDRIVSNPGSITGSIGVIMEMSNIKGLLDKIGVESYVVKSGEFKDIGSFTREMRQAEKQILQRVLRDVHQQFIDDVSKSRGIPLEQVGLMADGSIFSGREALDIGLVDQLGSFQDTVEAMKELAEIEGEPALVYEKPERMDLSDYFPRNLLRDLVSTKMDFAQYGAFYLMQ